MAHENVKQFLNRQLDITRPFQFLRMYLARNPSAGINGGIKRTSNHYVHERSTSLSMEVEGFSDPESGEVRQIDKQAEKAVNSLEALLTKDIVDINKKIYSSLEEEYDYLTADAQVLQRMDEREEYFDEEGEELNVTFGLIKQLSQELQQKVIQAETDLLNRSPEQVIQSAMERELYYDLETGEPFDASGVKKASELPPRVRAKVIDANRYTEVQYGDWCEFQLDEWKDKLEAAGFKDPEIAWSGFSSQGDGASFTCSYIDFKLLLKLGPGYDAKLMETNKSSEASVLVGRMLEAK